MKNFGNKLVESLSPLLLGVLAFFIIIGPRVLYPANIAWLGGGDPAQHYLGWLFFRNSEWSFPIGLNQTYGLELGSAILFSDSNPLLAFLFKPFAWLLPEPFQYSGIWLLACFVLQAWFGWKLAGLLSESTPIKVFSTGLFLFAPPMMWRLPVHLSLSGHFFILAALYLVLHPRLERRRLAWASLLATTALVNPYLLAMVALLWLADLVEKSIQRKLPIREGTIELAVILSVLFIVCWQAGYFSVGAGTSKSGFGYYRMNLLSIVDASGWSYVLRDIPESPGDYEGFNFLGLGVIFLFACALPAALTGNTGLLETIRRFPVLLVALSGLLVFAISNKVAFADHALAYPLPDTMVAFAEVFRSSGRMFWPVFYTIIIVVIFLIVRGNNTRIAVYLLGFALIIQLVDTSAAWKGMREKWMTEPKTTWVTPLVDPFWEKAGTQYKKVRWIPPMNISPQWLPIAAYAGTHGLATDAVYLARVSTLALEQARRMASDALKSGRYEADSLYILDESSFRQAAVSVDSTTDLLARVDGFNILAPGWKKCTDCPHLAGEAKLTDLVP
jgi:hypothetical protein